MNDQRGERVKALARGNAAMDPRFHVVVRRQWNDWRTAKYLIEDVEEPHWDSTSGGVQARSPRAFIHGYVRCNAMLEGELAHSCAHGEGPHRIKVCVTKGDNDPTVYAQLLGKAGPNPNVKKRA
jgi:hypothetical protein